MARSALTRTLVEQGLQRRDDRGPLRLMALAEGWAMVRRPGCQPFIIAEAAWRALPEQERAA